MMKRIFVSLFTVIMVLGLMSVATSATADEASIGNTLYATLEDAAANANPTDTIKLLTDVTLESTLTLPADITLNGNGKNITGTIAAGGNLTFAGETKVTSFSAGYYDRVITIGEGASLEITGTDRTTWGWGNTFNITGSISDAKTADKSTIKPSLKVPAGISITGSGATVNINDAYVELGFTSSSTSAASGTFDLNFTNSIVDFTGKFALQASTGNAAPTFKTYAKDSVISTGGHMVFSNTGCNTTFDNSTINVGNSLRNSGEMLIKNNATVTVPGMHQFGENAGNDGTITVDNATLDIDCSTADHAINGNGTGKIIATNGANVAVGHIKNSDLKLENGATVSVDGVDPKTGTATGSLNNVNITTDITSTLSGTELKGESSITVDVSNISDRTDFTFDSLVNITGNNVVTSDKIELGNNDGYVEIETDPTGKVVIVDKTPAATIGATPYLSVAEALRNLKDNDTLTIFAGTHEIGAVKLPTPLNNVTIQGAPDKVAIIKNSTIMASDGNSASYTDLTFDGIVFDNSNIVLGGQRTGEVIYNNITINNCEFKNIVNEGRLSAVHMNVDTDEAVENFTFTNNIIDGVSGSSNSGINISAVKGTVTIENNVIKNVAWNAIQIKNSTADTELFIEGNTFENAQATGENGIVNLYGIVGDVRVADNTMTESFPGQFFFCHVKDELKEDGFVYGGTFYGSDETLANYIADDCDLFLMAPGEYAVAEDKKYTVTYVGYHSSNVQAGTVLSEFVPDNDGYELVGWYTEPEFINEFDFSRPIIESVTLYPCWEDDKHDVDTGYVMIIMKMLNKLDISVEIIETEGGKIVVVVPEKVKYNKPAACTVIPDEGYAVKDVIVDDESVGAVTEYTIEKLKGKHTITAVFEKLPDTDANEQ